MREVNPLEVRFNANQAKRTVRYLVVVMVLLSLLIVGGVGYLVSKELDDLNGKLTAQNLAIREGNELIACLLALHDPANFPGANLEKCREKVKNTNNADGTFLSGHADGVFNDPNNPKHGQELQKEAQRGETGPPGPVGPQGPSGQAKPIQNLVDTINKTVDNTLNNIRIN